MNTVQSLADFGVVQTGPDTDTSGLWAATFTGGVNAHTLRFDDEPEHRALEALMERFGHTAVAVSPPKSNAVAISDDATVALVQMLARHPDVEGKGLRHEQIGAVVDALGGIVEPTPPLDPLPLGEGDEVEVRVPDYSGNGRDSDGDYCWASAEYRDTTPSGDVLVDLGGTLLAVRRADARLAPECPGCSATFDEWKTASDAGTPLPCICKPSIDSRS